MLRVRLKLAIQQAGSYELYEVLNYLFREGWKNLSADEIHEIKEYLKKLEIISKEAPK